MPKQRTQASNSGSRQTPAKPNAANARTNRPTDKSDVSQRRRRESRALTPGGSGRLEQVAEVLKRLLTWREAADQCLSAYFREHPKLGVRDRAQIAQACFDVLRHLRRYRHDAQMAKGSLEQLLAARGLAATLQEQACEAVLPVHLLDWARHCAAVDPASLPAALRYSLPDWLVPVFESLPDGFSYAAVLLDQAPLDLRVNSLKTTRADALEQINALLGDREFEAQPTPHSPDGIRLAGHPPVNRWALFEQGMVEVQDEGSQLLAYLVGAKRGEMVIDFCAGAGGKTLALGAMMRSTGRLYAFDVSAARLAKAKPRFARSGLSNIHPVTIRHERDDRVARLKGKAHRVLVDAPCTGLGTLRRNPDLKWRQTGQELERLCEQQASILSEASRCVRPGGLLVYATCSFLPQENERQIERFLAKHPDFELQDASEMLPESLRPTMESDGMVRLRPDRHGTDGFFAAVMRRRLVAS